mmetsp:Transcript_12092/g.37264  ORF Transcript_12092/g.37264 Transcript_12092/m.37264 type:complete len:241 (+) Transcript_12092:838-1560(+)
MGDFARRGALERPRLRSCREVVRLALAVYCSPLAGQVRDDVVRQVILLPGLPLQRLPRGLLDPSGHLEVDRVLLDVRDVAVGQRGADGRNRGLFSDVGVVRSSAAAVMLFCAAFAAIDLAHNHNTVRQRFVLRRLHGLLSRLHQLPLGVGTGSLEKLPHVRTRNRSIPSLKPGLAGPFGVADALPKHDLLGIQHGIPVDYFRGHTWPYIYFFLSHVDRAHSKSPLLSCPALGRVFPLRRD